jgi:hypothetical protein
MAELSLEHVARARVLDEPENVLQSRIAIGARWVTKEVIAHKKAAEPGITLELIAR